MADQPTRNPRGVQPNTDRNLSEIEYGASGSLVESLGSVADDLRQIGVDFGMRPHRVHAVRIKWTGGEIGRGEPVTVFDEPLLPNPKVLFNVKRASTSGGGVERGSAKLFEVSPRYTEDQIKRYFSLDLEQPEEGFIEIFIDDRDGTTERKRYVVSEPPKRRPEEFDWEVSLRKQDANRQRDKSYRQARRVIYR
jgi:hypothetical protein